MKKYSICLFSKKVRGGQFKEYVLVEKPEGTSLEIWSSFLEVVREALDNWGQNSEGGAEDGYKLYCEKVDVKPTSKIVNSIISKLNKENENLRAKLETNMDRKRFLLLGDSEEGEDIKTKIVECPDCLGWGKYGAKDSRRAGLKCERCKGEGKIAVPEDSTIPTWNIGGAGDMSHGT